MTPERWQQISRVYQSALEQAPAARAAFVADACRDDSDLRREVESLLAREHADVLVDRPVDVAAAVVLAEARGLSPGAFVGPYRVTALIGEGGMGQVYRARDTKLNRDVALKILSDAFVHDHDRVARFTREAHVLASLNHPNIGAIHGFEDSGPIHALVLELVEGPTLADRIARGPIPVDEALAIARQIAEALEAAHEHGIVHRDLKPANIKVRDDGAVKVLDFGLAKTAGPPEGGHYVRDSDGRSVRLQPDLTQSPTIMSPAMTAMGVILGTAAYMSPEQAKGKPADKRSDIWAFGCVLYEMLTGRRAFEGEDVSDTLAAVLRAAPDWAALPRDVPPAIRSLLVRCLAKDRGQRVADIAVAQFLLTEPGTMAGSTAADERSTRRMWLWVAAAAVVSAAVAGTAVWRVKPSAAGAPVVRFTIPLPEGQLFSATRQILAVAPDGHRVAYIANSRIYIRAVGDLAPHEVAGTEGASGTAVMIPMFAPDGGEIAFFSRAFAASGATYELKRIPASGGTPSTMAGPLATPCGASWGPDGVLIAVGRQILRVPPGGGIPTRLVEVSDAEAACSPQMLPGGRTVLFTLAAGRALGGAGALLGGESEQSLWDKARIVAQSVADGSRRVLIESASDARYLPTGHLLYAVAGTMYAVPFDSSAVEITGTAVPVIDGVRRSTPGQPTAATHLAVSATGTLAYLPGPASSTKTISSLVVGGADRDPVRLKIPPAPYVQPRVSPDGRVLAVGREDGSGSDIWTYDLSETTELRRLTFDRSSRFPVWSSDGRRVTFQSAREGDRGIFWQSVQGGPAERLTRAAGDEAHRPESWSRDGKRLLFSITRGVDQTEVGPRERSSLAILTLEGKMIEPFGAVPLGSVRGASFSPDGRWIAYALEGTGPMTATANDGVFIEPYPQSGERYQAPRIGRDFHPVWAADGKNLFYIPQGTTFVSVPVMFGAMVTFGAPVDLPARVPRSGLQSWQPRGYDVLPDGRFVVLRFAFDDGPSAAGTGGIRVVTNWFEELKQRVPSR